MDTKFFLVLSIIGVIIISGCAQQKSNIPEKEPFISLYSLEMFGKFTRTINVTEDGDVIINTKIDRKEEKTRTVKIEKKEVDEIRSLASKTLAKAETGKNISKKEEIDGCGVHGSLYYEDTGYAWTCENLPKYKSNLIHFIESLDFHKISELKTLSIGIYGTEGFVVEINKSSNYSSKITISEDATSRENLLTAAVQRNEEDKEIEKGKKYKFSIYLDHHKDSSPRVRNYWPITQKQPEAPIDTNLVNVIQGQTIELEGVILPLNNTEDPKCPFALDVTTKKVTIVPLKGCNGIEPKFSEDDQIKVKGKVDIIKGRTFLVVNEVKIVKASPDETDCGKEGETQPPEVCCQGLKALSAYSVDKNGNCEPAFTGLQVCSNCGNGICESEHLSIESKCNCPEDCK